MRVVFFLLGILLLGCVEKKEKNSPLFTDLTEKTNIKFINKLNYTESLNPYTYRNFYNGAGVAIGDMNNDGLQDIYFAGNQVANKLYLNKGNFQFEDISAKAGVACDSVWSTGVTMVDINADGFLDIYVCKSGDPNTPNRNNELFINNGDLTFTEKASEYGLDIKGLSVHAAFFDYDKDGDLDCYLLTNSIRNVGNYDLVKGLREQPDPNNGGNKFLINNNGKFQDYTKEAGIYNSAIGFGLGITLTDFNNDGWVDVFISNDFFERDYLYINNQDGTFSERITDFFSSLSMGSMGADVGDLNNDGLPELFVTEMLPDSLSRKKTKAIYENWDKYQINIKNGYYHQYPRNVFQVATKEGSYLELSRFSGLAATEWSWGALFFDMNNDGLKDVYVANGIYKDLLDRDYLSYTASNDNIRMMIENKKDVITELVDQMKSQPVPNYAFKNLGDFKFVNYSAEWGLDKETFSNGSAYGDLDNDGDLDLVVNNVNMPSLIYKNNTDLRNKKSLRLKLIDTTSYNYYATGSEVTAFIGQEIIKTDNYVTRGFQSTVEPIIHLGMGDKSVIDSLEIIWPDNNKSVLKDVATNKFITIYKKRSRSVNKNTEVEMQENISLNKINLRYPVIHRPNGLVDFNRDRLLPQMYSNEYPKIAKGDIDGDQIEELYIGGGKGHNGAFIDFSESTIKSFVTELPDAAEESASILFDVDGDDDLDLYYASGGRSFSKSSSLLMDKIYLNDGEGNFSASPYPLPFTEFISTAVVKHVDLDNDGDQDLVIGERFHPFYYGLDGSILIFQNDGNGKFQDVTKSFINDHEIGMVTDIEITDYNNDKFMDLVVVGDWMPIKLYENVKGKKFEDVSNELGFSNTEGWWNEVEVADVDNDGKVDLLLGNHGLNTFFKEGDRMYVADFDKNGSIEQIFCTKIDGRYFPIHDKDELISQLPSLKKQFVFYEDYARKPIDEIFDEAVLDEAKIFQVNLLKSMVALSGDGQFKLIPLPNEAQYAPIYALKAIDIDNDGRIDLFAGGNQFKVKPQFGRYDASQGWFFKGSSAEESLFNSGMSLQVPGEIRDIEIVALNNRQILIIAKHDGETELYEVSY